MTTYQIIETDGGLMVSEVQPGVSAEVAAERAGGVIVDPGPYRSYEEAYDALLALAEQMDAEE